MIKDFLQKKCNTCFFLQDGECALSKNRCFPCDMNVKKIKGVTSIEFYVNMVNSKKLSIRALYFSLLSLLASIIGLVINYIRATH